jgi:hypothetical protein
MREAPTKIKDLKSLKDQIININKDLLNKINLQSTIIKMSQVRAIKKNPRTLTTKDYKDKTSSWKCVEDRRQNMNKQKKKGKEDCSKIVKDKQKK